MSEAISVIVPAHNEEAGIGESIRGIQRVLEESTIPHEIIAVDDASTDGTRDVICSLPGVRLLYNQDNQGYGASLKKGIQAAHYQWILISDGDASYPPECTRVLIEDIAGLDMVIGARRSSEIGAPVLWMLAKASVQALLIPWVGRWIPDLNSGSRIFRKEMADEFEPILSNGFSYSTWITIAALRTGRRVEFRAVPYRLRKGQSKVRPFSYTRRFCQSLYRSVRYARRVRTGKRSLRRWDATTRR